jgi:RNA polymerase primary sigma factor
MRQLKITASITTREPILDRYLREIDKLSLISAEEEVRLAELIRKGDKNALDQLTKANLRFVISVAKKYQGQGLSLSDMINEGNLGLIDAARRFDPTRGFKFASYAVWYIRQRILIALADHARLIRMPLNKIAVNSKVYKANCMLEQQLDRMPSVDELAELLGMNPEDVNKSLNDKNNYVSLDTPISNDDDSGTMYDILENPDPNKTETELFHKSSLKTELTRLFQELSSRQKEVLCWFFGIDMDHPLSLDEIAKRMDLTKERVRQIKDKAIEKLRTVCDTNRLRGFLAT